MTAPSLLHPNHLLLLIVAGLIIATFVQGLRKTKRKEDNRD